MAIQTQTYQQPADPTCIDHYYRYKSDAIHLDHKHAMFSQFDTSSKTSITENVNQT